MDSSLQIQNGLVARLRRSRNARYWMAVLLPTFAGFLRFLLNPVLGTNFGFLTFYPAIMITAWIGGIGPAIVSVILSVAGADLLFFAPRYTFALASTQEYLLTGLFAFVGIATGAISEAYRRMLRRSERDLEVIARQQAELQQIYATTPIGLGFLDEQLRYIRVNNALASFNGVPAEQHPGRHISEILSPETAHLIAPALRQVLETGKPILNVEMAGPRAPASEELRHVRVSFYPVQIGALKGIHGVVEDVTAEKQSQDALKAAEEQLRYAAKMEAVGRLAGGVAHDFNNLLMVISSYTELLEHQLSAPDHLKKLRAISGATQRAARLTQQLLAFGRKQPMQVQAIEVDAWLRNFEQSLHTALRDDIEVKLDLNAGEVSVGLDPAMLEQALTGLAVNARDAMPHGGEVRLQTRLCNVEIEESRAGFSIAPGAYVELSFSDSGVGMPADVQARIFDPFFTTKEQGKGSGLGLAMVYGIVKQSGGYIDVQSAEQQGTTFRLWLPVAREGVTPEPRLQQLPLNAGSGTILLAEDEATLREAICETLTALGYRVKQARDGSEALALLQQNVGDIDLLLTDAVMPNMGGLDLIERLQTSQTPIKTILMSGYTNSVSTETLTPHLNRGLIFLQKPFAQDELAKAVRRALAN
ncbi:MAG: DUF4118 domain-containing protein [Acidobacteria bacterium]|nr:DUF4118 domain-containing protein [Acidobacteriota bacterium]